jgi:hypothetical protein
MPIGKNGNGLTLLERFIPDGLSNAATTLVYSLKINSTSEKVWRRRRVVVKRRNIYGEQLADLANLYFRMSTIPIRFWSKVDDWRRWEIGCFKMLNGDRFRVFASGARTVCEEKLPRKSLWDHQRRGTLLNVLFLFHRRTIWFPTGRTASSPLGKRQKNLIAAIPEQSCIKQSREEQRVALNLPA